MNQSRNKLKGKASRLYLLLLQNKHHIAKVFHENDEKSDEIAGRCLKKISENFVLS